MANGNEIIRQRKIVVGSKREEERGAAGFRKLYVTQLYNVIERAVTITKSTEYEIIAENLLMQDALLLLRFIDG